MDHFFNKLQGNGNYETDNKSLDEFDNESTERSAVLPGNIYLNQVFDIERFKVRVFSFLAEGGQAHIYLVEVIQVDPKYSDKITVGSKLVVKRIAVPDLQGVQATTMEVEVLRKLSLSANVVTLYASSTQEITNGEGYETFILMEYCADGSLVEFMQKREGTRLHEPEILFIFHEICLGVAAMHYQEPPIIHRDLKVENILISSTKKFKLCDFGSCTTRHIPPNTSLSVQQVTKLEEELMACTTLQYRAPEMIDLYQRRGLTEKTDLWALGVLLYKLCFFITPFEDAGSLAILNCRYEFPTNSFSHSLIGLIKALLQEDPLNRPNIYQIVKGVSKMRNVPCTIPEKDFSSGRPNDSSPNELTSQRTEPILTQEIPIMAAVAPPPVDLGFDTTNITPMRRGRPTRNKDGTNPKPTPLNSILPNVASRKVDAKALFSPSTDDPFELLAQGVGSLSNSSSTTLAKSVTSATDWGTSKVNAEPTQSLPRPPAREGDRVNLTGYLPRPPSRESSPPPSHRRLPRPPSFEAIRPNSNKISSLSSKPTQFNFDDFVDVGPARVEGQFDELSAFKIDPPTRSSKFDRKELATNRGSPPFNLPKAPSRDLSPDSFTEEGAGWDEGGEHVFYAQMDDDAEDAFAGRSLLGNPTHRSTPSSTLKPTPPPLSRNLIDLEVEPAHVPKPPPNRNGQLEFDRFLGALPTTTTTNNLKRSEYKPPIPSRTNRSRSTSLSTDPDKFIPTPSTTAQPQNSVRPLPPPRSISRPKPNPTGPPPSLPPKPSSLTTKKSPKVPAKPIHLQTNSKTPTPILPPPKPPRKNPNVN